jgi:hypothetical protein
MIGHPLRVRELLDEVSRGEVLLPEIQRAYVWKRPQVAKLIDSLYRQYPAGQILLWDTINLPITKNLEGAEKTSLPTVGRPKIIRTSGSAAGPRGWQRFDLRCVDARCRSAGSTKGCW